MGRRRACLVPQNLTPNTYHLPSWRQRRRRQVASLGPLGRVRRLLIQLLQADLDRPLKLDVDAAHVILRAVVDLDLRIGAVILDVPADVVEEERVLRLGGQRAVSQGVARRDPYHSAPGPLPDQWPQLQQLEGVAEDVAIRTS